VNSINPYRLEGQKTAALRSLTLKTRRIPSFARWNAGNATAYWRGYVEYERLNARRIFPDARFQAAVPRQSNDRIIEHPNCCVQRPNPASWYGSGVSRFAEPSTSFPTNRFLPPKGG
jgi:threonine synthase